VGGPPALKAARRVSDGLPVRELSGPYPKRQGEGHALPGMTPDTAGHRMPPLGVDVVYFLMWPGWEGELRSNRWHYARRWARLLPVVLVQPTEEIAGGALATRGESRIENCHVLQVQASNYWASYLEDVLVQVGQVTADMQARRTSRALLWCYNPTLAGLYAALPAVARVFHATENYFDFESLPRFLLDCQRTAVRISDLTVAVSEGVAAALRANVPGARIEIVTNGCDYEEYSRYRPDERLRSAARGWERVAVYAGNINARLDFVLLERCVRASPKTLYAFVGPVMGLETEDAARWEGLLRKSNVTHFEEQDPGDLPGLYGAADVGIVPYKQTRVLVENGFPLKVLEMCATGLPVVSTFMKPIVGLTEGLVVVRDHEEFLEKLSCTSRACLTDSQKEEMSRVCQQHDYDRKFATVLSFLQETGSDTNPPETTRVDGLLVQLAANQWRKLGVREWRERSTRKAMPLIGRLRAERVLKGLLAVRVILRDSALRGLLLSGALYRCRGARIGLSRLVADLFRLGILRSTDPRVARLGLGFEVRLQYDRPKERLVVETIGPEDLSAPSPPSGRSWPPMHGPLREIIWDHSAMGTVVPISLAGRAAWVFMGPDGQYKFRALTALAERDPDSVWEAFCPRAASGR
jgi:glycosyltransferase involved in cell wall biosynthesis